MRGIRSKYWLSTPRMTGMVITDKPGNIQFTPPIWYRFKGQPLGNLVGWLEKQGGFQMVSLEEQIMKVIIAGSRTFADYQFLSETCDMMAEDWQVTSVICGMARG